jgi:hypothetical protein
VLTSGATRLTATINYLRSVDEPLANDLVQILQEAGVPLRNQVSDPISLSGHTPSVAERKSA